MIYTTAIQKGGTAKTTTAAALAWAGASKGLRVLALDLDPQGQLSYTLGADTTTGAGNTFDLLTGTPAADLVQHTEQNIDVIPASWNLSTVTSGKGSARRLQRALKPIRDEYDLIIIDTPPTAGELQYNALQAATGLIIPLQATSYSLQSLYQITDTARQIRASNPDLSFTGVVITQFDGRSTIARQMADTIRKTAEEMGVPYLGRIRAGVAIQEAATLRQSLFKYAPKSNVAQDYMELFNKIMEG